MQRTITIITSSLLLIGASAAGWGGQQQHKTEPSEPSKVQQVQQPEQKKEEKQQQQQPSNSNQNTSSTPDKSGNQGKKQELLQLGNEERARYGAGALQVDPEVVGSAQYKAEDMANGNYFSHSDKSGTTENGMNKLHKDNPECRSWAENIEKIKDPTKPISSQRMMQMWIDSKSHHETLKNAKYTHTGFGIAVSKDGTMYAVQHFCQK